MKIEIVYEVDAESIDEVEEHLEDYIFSSGYGYPIIRKKRK